MYFYVDFQLLDMYTNTIADVGVLTDSGHGGTYAFVGPGWRGTIPKGVVRMRGAVVGSYGTDYLERARLAEETLGTQVPAQAVYFSASHARSGTTTTALAGTRSYQIRFPAAGLPPHGSDGFWSITLYNAAGFLVANPIGRYSIGDQTPGRLLRGDDGSLTIVVSASRPGGTDVNWLPAPTGAFSLVLRVYDPAPQVLDGSWSPPVIRATS